MKLGIIAGIVSILASVPYTISIFKGITKPNRASWFIWTVVGILLFLSYKATGAHNTIWVPLVYAILPAFTAILSIKYGIGGFSRIDIFCLIGAMLGILIWLISGTPILALISFIVIDSFGTVPTIKKAYYHPEQENTFAWALMVLANILNVIAIEEMRFSLLAYPIYLLSMGLVILGLLLRKRIFYYNQKIST